MSLDDLAWLESLPPEQQAALLTEGVQALRERKLEDYAPYPKQRQFHTLGATMRERLLRAGNQQGKTYSTGAEMAYHLTGLYPAWWQGRRWERPIVGWASGETGEATRDNAQRVLLGMPDEQGTGLIPKTCLGLNQGQYGMASGVAALYDFIRVRHHTGGAFDGWSMLRFKYYAQGRAKWQGPPVDFVWYDEEPPEDVYAEGMARTIATGGMVALSFTPLLGMSGVVRRFLMEKATDRVDVNMTIHDAEHISPEERDRIIASFPAHQREARANGTPTLGSGLIFPVDEKLISVPAFPIPGFWPRIAGIDFGWDHPTAVAWLAHDRDTDTVYVIDAYRRSEAAVPIHAAAIKAKGSWIPVAWPHDGNNETAGGPQLAAQYRAQQVAMRPANAKFAPDPRNPSRSLISVEAGLSEMLTRMETGRFKVFAHLHDWFEEFRLYHREDGRIVKVMDDLLSATRYALMDLRYAKVQTASAPLVTPQRPLDVEMNY